MSEMQAVGSTRPGHYGVAGAAGVSLQRVATGSVWNLQGATGSPAFTQQVRLIWGIADLPATHRIVRSPGHTILWVGPQSWLVLGDSLPEAAPLQADFSHTLGLVNQAGGALFDVSAARVGWTLRGPRALDLLARGCPLDLHVTVFAPDSCAQTLFGHVAALVHRHADGDFTLYVARSFADDIWATLCANAAQYGYEVLPAST